MTGLALGALLLLSALPAAAGHCGGAVPCRCGDHVVADAILDADLDECPDLGLRVVSGSVDCAGHRIVAADRSGATAGIWLDGAVGRTVMDCRIEGFVDGILVDGGSDNVLRASTLAANTHGIWVGSGASRTVIESNEVRDNDDEGIHLGSGTSGGSVSGNWIHHNRRENLYLLNTERNSISGNVLDQSKAAGILLKHSSENLFVDNRVLKRSIVVRGDSHDNVFRGTVLAAGGFVFQAFEEDEGGGIGRGRIKFGRSGAGRDRLRLTYWFEASGEIRPDGEDVTVALADTDSLLLLAEIPSGKLVEAAPAAFGCRGQPLGAAGELRELRVADSVWRRDVRATSDLTGTDRDELSLSLTIGEREFEATPTWTRVKSGWRLRS